MKRILVFSIILLSLLISLTACEKEINKTESFSQGTSASTIPSETDKAASNPKQSQTLEQETQVTTDSEVSQEIQQSEETEAEITQPQYEEEQSQEEDYMSLQMVIGSTPVFVEWEDNDAVEALTELCRSQPLTIQMSMYGGFEQVGSIGSYLPTNDVQTTTSAGDIVLYSGNQMVVFYGSNSWAYTRLGHITDQSTDDMIQLLSNGDTAITISLK